MQAYSVYQAVDGEAYDYERPYIEANRLLDEGKSLLESLRPLSLPANWTPIAANILRNINKDTEIYWNKNKKIVRKIICIYPPDQIVLRESKRNRRIIITPAELVKNIMQIKT